VCEFAETHGGPAGPAMSLSAAPDEYGALSLEIV